MTFNIGDRVVHPQHGVGEVVKLDERDFESGVMRRYYEVSIPAPFMDDPRTRQTHLVKRLKEGTIRVQCEVIRDLYSFGEHKSMYGSMGGFFRQTQNVLCEEWAPVEGMTLDEATQEVNVLLDKSRRLAAKA